jgi:16S rRNA (cytosine967-C5)-methyltransferase
MNARPSGRPSTARAVALEAVRRVVDEGAYSNRVIPALLERSGLDRRDRAFAAELAYGTLRRLVPIDHAIEARANRPIARISTTARHAIRLGAYQLLFAAVAPHAAVGETVGLTNARERGFANAVLRRIAEKPPAPPTGDEDADVAVRTGLAPWAIRELRHLVGNDTERAAAALAERGPLCVRVNTCVGDRDAFRGALADAEIGSSPANLDLDCFLIDGGDPRSIPGWTDGRFAVQDQASAFVVRTLDLRPGERVLDACAAPGGKAVFAACLTEPGGLVVATDVRPGRLGLVASQARRLRVHTALVAMDATTPALRGPFDRVLVDAPCSGIGSARRRPELLWKVPRDGLSTLARRQVAIASATAELLRPGGRLVYSVCTFPRAETDAACDAILRHRPELRPIPTSGPDGPALRHRLWPHVHGSDGMFVAAFERGS